MVHDHHGYEGSKDHCKAIDKALTSDNFPSLRSVRLYEEIPFDYFPTLQSEGLLEVARYKILFVGLVITLILFVHSL